MFTIPPEVRFLSGGGGGATSYTLQTASFSPVAGTLNVADTTSTAFTSTLPVTPALGDFLVLADAKGTWGTNYLTINPNGQLLEGAYSNLTCDVANSYLTLVFVGGTTGWTVYHFTSSGGGGSQTPWASDIDGGDFSLGNINHIVIGDILTNWDGTSASQVNGSASFAGLVIANGGITSSNPSSRASEQFGSGASAGNYASAFGNSSYAGDYSIAIGVGASAGNYATAFGGGANAIGSGSTAFGSGGVLALGDYSTAFGVGAYARNANEINFSNLDSIYGFDNGNGGYTQLGIYNGVANFAGNGAFFGGNIIGASFIKAGGVSSEFLKADGSVDSLAYLPCKAKGTTTLVTGTKTITILGLTSSDQAFIQLTIPGGTLGNNFKAICTTDTLTITSVVAAGIIQTLDTSSLNYLVI